MEIILENYGDEILQLPPCLQTYKIERKLQSNQKSEEIANIYRIFLYIKGLLL